jgi:hypothetical protein
MFEQVPGQSCIAAEHRKVQRGRVPVAAAHCDRPAQLDHQPYGGSGTFGGHVGQQLQLPRREGAG